MVRRRSVWDVERENRRQDAEQRALAFVLGDPSCSEWLAGRIRRSGVFHHMVTRLESLPMAGPDAATEDEIHSILVDEFEYREAQ